MVDNCLENCTQCKVSDHLSVVALVNSIVAIV